MTGQSVCFFYAILRHLRHAKKIRKPFSLFVLTRRLGVEMGVQLTFLYGPFRGGVRRASWTAESAWFTGGNGMVTPSVIPSVGWEQPAARNPMEDSGLHPHYQIRRTVALERCPTVLPAFEPSRDWAGNMGIGRRMCARRESCD